MTDVSIWDHVAAHVPPEGPGLLPGGWPLPDDGDRPGTAQWAPGAADGVRLLHSRLVVDDETADEVCDLLRAALASRKPRSYDRLYERLRGTDAVTYVDRVLERIPSLRPTPERVYDLGRVLVTTARDRAAVKLGIALFGFFEAGHHVGVVTTLGRHDEFTFYCVRALSTGLDDPEPAVWELARQASGWGRVHAVRELLRLRRRPEPMAWALREGFRNDVAPEYLAGPVAAAAGLADALAAPAVDDDLLDAGADIVAALVGRSGRGMDAYEEGASATAALVQHLRARASTPGHLLAVRAIDAFVCGDGDWSARARRGWTPEARSDLHARCESIAAWPRWTGVVSAGLEAPDDAGFRLAVEAARLLGMDPVPALVHRLMDQPLDEASWVDVMRHADGRTIDEVVALAEVSLPLGRIATGPAGMVAIGPEYHPHECLDAVLAGLARWPGRGWPLVQAALSSPVVRNRNLALRVLHQWGQEAWPAGAGPELRAAAEREPEAEVLRRIQRLLAGQPLEQATSVRR